MTFEKVRWVWINGEIVPADNANVVASTGLVSETIRCYETPEGPAVFNLDEHVERLFTSALLRGIRMPFLKNEIGSAICQVIEANRFSSCRVRPTVFTTGRAVGVAVEASPSSSLLPNAARYRKRLHFVDQCFLAGAYSALPCI